MSPTNTISLRRNAIPRSIKSPCRPPTFGSRKTMLNRASLQSVTMRNSGTRSKRQYCLSDKILGDGWASGNDATFSERRRADYLFTGRKLVPNVCASSTPASISDFICCAETFSSSAVELGKVCPAQRSTRSLVRRACGGRKPWRGPWARRYQPANRSNGV